MSNMSGSNDDVSPLLRRGRPALLASALCLAALLAPAPAEACGGFFCSASNPVNQAAERIVFARNGDGTVTAVIEIQYQGPSESFSWLLPISSVPMGDQIAVASNAAFQRLQQATNPQYNLTVRVEGECDGENDSAPSLNGGFNLGPTASADSPGAGRGVTVEAQGVVGSFEWTVISLDAGLESPADAAVLWLGENGYDVPPGAPGLLGPYLDDGLYLLALKLKKGADAGSIRPIVLTYDAEKPMIPIKLTAVAANENMGVMTWVLGEQRAVPENYYALELNEARINWFNASQNYDQVVSEAANAAGGQGFVTEMAGSTATLRQTVWSDFEEQTWGELRARVGQAPTETFAQLTGNFGFLDGFWEVVAEHVTFPNGETIEQARGCPGCGMAAVVGPGFVAAMEENVIEPMRVVQDLLHAHPQVTRLYTTMSAAEMTVDPLFTFNPDLPAISNIHTAERVIECAPGYFQSEAPWRIELPQGTVIRGGPNQVGVWPTAFASQAPNRRILRQGASGQGRVLEDRSTDIQSAVRDYNAAMPAPPRREASCSTSGNASPAASLWAGALALCALLGLRKRAGRPGSTRFAG
jgi:hypothetical protein